MAEEYYGVQMIIYNIQDCKLLIKQNHLKWLIILK